jgi:hypothetical protein
MTNEELDEARAKEAGGDPVKAARLARENWAPPKPVDSDVLAFREWYAGKWPLQTGESILAGAWDHGIAATGYLAGAAASEARIKALEYEVRELKAQNFRMLSLEDQAQARDRGEA